MRRKLLTWLGVFSMSVAIVRGAEPVGPAQPSGPLVPVALAWGPRAQLHVALRDARRIATVDTQTWKVVHSRPLPFRPSDLVFDSEHKTLLVGGMDGEFLAVDSVSGAAVEQAAGRGPTRVLALGKDQAAVASLWDEAVRIVDWKSGRIIASHALPFAPGAMVSRPGGRVVVADAFGGAIADLLPGMPSQDHIRSLDGVSMHGLAISGDRRELLLVHMAQYDTVPITQSNIDWGLVLSSRLSAVRLTDFEGEHSPGEPLPRRRITLDGSRHGAADPSALAVTPDGGKLLITLAGAHQVLLDDRTLGVASGDPGDVLPLGHNQRLAVVEVGRTPVALALDPSGTIAVTADSMSDTLTAIKVADLTLIAKVPLGDETPERTAVQRGEALFHDGRLALDRWMSCASCHTNGHSNGLNFDTLGDGDYGAPKNTPSLLGVGVTRPFTWTGRFPELTGQIHQSLMTSLRGPNPDQDTVEDLAAYLRTLAPPPGRRPSNDPAVVRGAAVFRARKCDGCHRPPPYTSEGVRDVGVDDGPGGHRRFNPPSLRGVSRSAPYFHDGRAKSLGEVLSIHSPGQPDHPTPAEREDLVAFLESL